jgi:pSer/pThr/pTyr-binding forkhead associated (FHA) protein
MPAAKPVMEKKIIPSSGIAQVHFKHGPYAGKSFALNRLPFFIGRDPMNDLCLNDPHVLGQHAKIFETSNGYYLMDLGGETYVNGQMVKRNSAFLKPGDVVRLGKSALFVFSS